MYRLKPEFFNLNYTLDCGQVFRWEQDGDWWTGVVGDQVIRISQEDGELLVDSKLPTHTKKYNTILGLSNCTNRDITYTSLYLIIF